MTESDLYTGTPLYRDTSIRGHLYTRTPLCRGHLYTGDTSIQGTPRRRAVAGGGGRRRAGGRRAAAGGGVEVSPV